MTIQFNTDKNTNGEQRVAAYYTAAIESELARFDEHLTRIEVHLSDEDGPKDGFNTKRCMLEARVAHNRPFAVVSQADSFDQAIGGALSKLVGVLDTHVDKLNSR